MSACRSRNVASSSSCCRATSTSSPGFGCWALVRAQASSGLPPFMRPARLLNASCVVSSSRVAMASRRSIGTETPSSSLSFCSNFSRPSRNDPRAFGPISFSRSCTYGSDRLARFGLCVGKLAEQVQVVDIGQRTRQVVVDERERSAHRLDAHFDEDAWRVLDVVAGGLNQSRRLAQLREHAAGAFGRGRVREQHLPGKARRQQVRVMLRMPLPGADLFELEDSALHMGGQHAMLEPLDGRQRFGLDLVEATQIAGQRVDLALDCLAARDPPGGRHRCARRRASRRLDASRGDRRADR